MADPISWIALGTAAAGGILGAMGKSQEGKAQAQQAEYQAGVADLNAKIAKQNEDYASAQGEEEAVNTGLRGRAKVGAETAGFGAMGTDVNSGSAKQVLTSQAELNARDIATVRNKAARVAYGYATEAEQDTAQATLYRLGGSNIQAAIPLNVASSLISGASSVSSKYLQGKSAGLFS